MFIERPPLRVQLILIKRAAMVMSASKKKIPNNIIKLIKWGWSETLQLSGTDDAWKSSEVDPCVYAQSHKTACLTHMSQHQHSSLQEITRKIDEVQEASFNHTFKVVLQNRKKNTSSVLYVHIYSRHLFFFHPASILSLLSLFCLSLKSPQDSGRLTVVQ